MKVENALYPTPDRIKTLLAHPSDRPVVMLNLLKFREKALYPDGRKSDLTGREAYMIYAEAMTKVVLREGGRFVFSGRIDSIAIGEVEQLWDIVALMEYPSPAAFARIATSPEVAEIGVHRAAGLEGQLLIPVSEVG
jgi:uncharacterized protein (DUF1330 family)